MKISFDRQVMKDKTSRGNIFFAAFYHFLDGLLMVAAAFVLTYRIGTFHRSTQAVAILIVMLTALGTIRTMLTIFSLLGQTALIATYVDNK